MSPFGVWRQRGVVWAPRFAVALHWTRFGAYVLLSAAGIWSIVAPPVSVAATGTHRSSVAWAILLTGSSLWCAYGALTGKWIGEYVGLVPLGAAALAFALSAMARGGPSIAGGLFLLGFAFIVVTRWQEVTILRIKAQQEALERTQRRNPPT